MEHLETAIDQEPPAIIVIDTEARRSSTVQGPAYAEPAALEVG